MRGPKNLSGASGMPQMGAAFQGWQRPIQLQKVTETVVDGIPTSTTTSISFAGTVQPLSPRQLYLKPEGQRAFTWLQIHCTSGAADLTTGDKIVYNGRPYKIMALLDYSLNAYVEYHAMEDYST